MLDMGDNFRADGPGKDSAIASQWVMECLELPYRTNLQERENLENKAKLPMAFAGMGIILVVAFPVAAVGCLMIQKMKKEEDGHTKIQAIDEDENQDFKVKQPTKKDEDLNEEDLN